MAKYWVKNLAVFFNTLLMNIIYLRRSKTDDMSGAKTNMAKNARNIRNWAQGMRPTCVLHASYISPICLLHGSYISPWCILSGALSFWQIGCAQWFGVL